MDLSFVKTPVRLQTREPETWELAMKTVIFAVSLFLFLSHCLHIVELRKSRHNDWTNQLPTVWRNRESKVTAGKHLLKKTGTILGYKRKFYNDPEVIDKPRPPDGYPDFPRPGKREFSPKRTSTTHYAKQ